MLVLAASLSSVAADAFVMPTWYTSSRDGGGGGGLLVATNFWSLRAPKQQCRLIRRVVAWWPEEKYFPYGWIGGSIIVSQKKRKPL